MLIAEMIDAKNDSELLDVARKIVDLDGQRDSADLTDAEILDTALEIVRRQQREEGRQAGYRTPIGGMNGAVRPVALAVGITACVFLIARWLAGKL